MTRIRVDPDILNQCANRISDAQSRLDGSSQAVMNAGNDAPSYDGQFGPRVQSICHEAGSRGRTLADRERQLAASLHSKAQAFATADMASLQGFSRTGRAIEDWQEGSVWLEGWNRYRFLKTYQIESIVKLGRLLILGEWPAFLIASFCRIGLGVIISGTFLGIKLHWLPEKSSHSNNNDSKDNSGANTATGSNSNESQSQTSSKDPTSSDTSKIGQPTQNKPTTNTVLLQTNPEESDDLSVPVYESGDAHEKVDWSPFYEITDVKTHIKAYGCLMTAYTMLLKDQGEDIKVTDLYKENYRLIKEQEKAAEIKAKGSSTIETDLDAAYKKDQRITLNHMNAQPGMVSGVSENYQEGRGKFGGDTGVNRADLESSLKDTIREKGSIIIHVKTGYSDGHWIAVTQNSDNTFNVRDPMKGVVGNLSLNDIISGKNYQISDDLAYKTIELKTKKV